MRSDKWTLGLAIVLAGAALVTLVWWIPADIESGSLIHLRRQVVIGDALAPTATAVGILLVALALGVSALLHPSSTPTAPDSRSLMFLLRIGFVLAVGIVLMRYAGPAFVSLLNHMGVEPASYRELRDTVPYKYIGFALGGTVMVAGVIQVVEDRLSASAIWVAIAVVVVLAVLYDVPFNDLLLPPNGDI